MTMYPASLTNRFAQKLRAIQARITRLEARTVGIDSGYPLAALPAVINPGYTSGNPTVYVNGATVLTGPYQYLSSYTPTASDSVLVLPVGELQAYVILGKLS